MGAAAGAHSPCTLVDRTEVPPASQRGSRVKVWVSRVRRARMLTARVDFMMSSISLAARFALLASVAGLLWHGRPAAAAQSASPKSILVLHTYAQQSMFRPVFDRALQQALNRRGMGDAEVYVETLESNRFPGDTHAALFQYYLGQKYANRKIDAVIAVWDRALNYMLTHRDELFPDAPVAAVVARPRAFGPDSQVAQVTAGDRALATARLALTFHPTTRKIFVIDGTLQSNDDVQQEFTDELKPLASQIRVEFLRDLPLTELLERVKSLPDDSVLLFVRQTMRSRTQSMPQRDALEQVVQRGPRPDLRRLGSACGTRRGRRRCVPDRSVGRNGRGQRNPTDRRHARKGDRPS